jgi:ADP-heptose:LPS heptosyltransferase
MKILIRTPKFIGDTIMMLPALFLLQKRYPDAHFTILSNPHFEALFRGMNITFIVDNSRQEKGFSNNKNSSKHYVKRAMTWVYFSTTLSLVPYSLNSHI